MEEFHCPEIPCAPLVYPSFPPPESVATTNLFTVAFSRMSDIVTR